MRPVAPLLTWFLVTIVFCLVVLLCAVLCYRVAQRAALQRLRDQLAADLHDDIGASLSQLVILSEVLHHRVGAADTQLADSLNTLANISRETIRALSDIVWATNPQQDGVSNLLRRMRHLASEILPAAGIDFSFHAPKLEDDVRLEVELRRQVFLIFKESLNNLVRHSGCKCAGIELQVEGAYLTLQISDDGNGFDCAQPQEGNGLRSLYRRAQTLRADFSITSSSTGTMILLCVRFRQTAWQQAQQKLCSSGSRLHTYLNRGVTAFAQQPTLPSQPISAAVKKSSVGH